MNNLYVVPLVVPIYCYRDDRLPSSATLITSHINLGTIKVDEKTTYRIYGEPDILVAVQKIDFQEVSDFVRKNLKTTFLFKDSKDNKSTSSFLDITLLPDSSLNGISLNCQLCLKTFGNREYKIPLRAEIR